MLGEATIPLPARSRDQVKGAWCRSLRSQSESCRARWRPVRRPHPTSEHAPGVQRGRPRPGRADYRLGRATIRASPYAGEPSDEGRGRSNEARPSIGGCRRGDWSDCLWGRCHIRQSLGGCHNRDRCCWRANRCGSAHQAALASRPAFLGGWNFPAFDACAPQIPPDRSKGKPRRSPRRTLRTLAAGASMSGSPNTVPHSPTERGPPRARRAVPSRERRSGARGEDRRHYPSGRLIAELDPWTGRRRGT